MKPHKFLLLAAAAAVVAERAEPTAHFILLATQRTGSTWVMSELSKHSSCIATGTELFLDHKGFTWTQSSRARCLKMLYGSDIDKKKKPYKCSEKFKKVRVRRPTSIQSLRQRRGSPRSSEAKCATSPRARTGLHYRPSSAGNTY